MVAMARLTRVSCGGAGPYVPHSRGAERVCDGARPPEMGDAAAGFQLRSGVHDGPSAAVWDGRALRACLPQQGTSDPPLSFLPVKLFVRSFLSNFLQLESNKSVQGKDGLPALNSSFGKVEGRAGAARKVIDARRKDITVVAP